MLARGMVPQLTEARALRLADLRSTPKGRGLPSGQSGYQRNTQLEIPPQPQDAATIMRKLYSFW